MEPFDNSFTDHTHYWEDGGATYHTRFDSAELIRGQEADHWTDIVAPDQLRWRATVADDRQIVWFTGGRSTVGTSQPEIPEDGKGLCGMSNSRPLALMLTR